MIKKRKQHPPPGDDASTAVTAPGRVGRDEQGGAIRRNIKPNCGAHLELGRLRLKTCSKFDSSIAQTTWPTYLYLYLYIYQVYINNFIEAGPSRVQYAALAVPTRHTAVY